MFDRLIKKWKSKSSIQKKIFFEAYLSLIYSWIFLKLFSFKKIIIYQGLQNWNKRDDYTEYSQIDLKNISWSIITAAKYTPFKSLCLAQALAAQRMLKKRKMNGLMFLGVAKDNIKGMTAHAWVISGNKTITGGDSLEKYSVINTYSWN